VPDHLKHAGASLDAALDAAGSDGAGLAVDEEATLLLLNHGSRITGRIVELSLKGCSISVRDQFVAGIQVRVEAAFKVNGIALRFSGVTEWTEDQKLVGIRFVDVTSRRMDELIEVLAELAADAKAKAAKDAAEAAAAGAGIEDAQQASGETPPEPTAAEGTSHEAAVSPAALPPPIRPLAAVLPIAAKLNPNARMPVSPFPAVRPLEPELTVKRTVAPVPVPLVPVAGPLAEKQPEIAAASQAPAKPSGRDRRTQSRHDVDTSAVIFLVNVGSRVRGRILNLSVGGCRIRTDEKFPVGIYTRVETEFHLEGLPFRLGGVVQAIQDRLHVGIRFLDMSERKRGQLEQLIEEIEELREREKNQEGQAPEQHPPQA
jgi:hypothetical protein